MLRLLTIVGFAALCLWSAFLLTQDLETADQQFVARRIEGGFAVGAANVAELVRQADIRAETGASCRSELLLSEMTIRMAQLDMQDSTLDYEGWQNGMEGADRFLRRAVMCSPSSANVWVRLAMVSMAIAEEPSKLASYLLMSAKLGRSERPVLEARVALWRRVSANTLARVSDLVVSDFVTLLENLPLSDIRPLVSDLPDGLMPYVQSAIERAGAKKPEIVEPATTWLNERAVVNTTT